MCHSSLLHFCFRIFRDAIILNFEVAPPWAPATWRSRLRQRNANIFPYPPSARFYTAYMVLCGICTKDNLKYRIGRALRKHSVTCSFTSSSSQLSKGSPPKNLKWAEVTFQCDILHIIHLFMCISSLYVHSFIHNINNNPIFLLHLIFTSKRWKVCNTLQTESQVKHSYTLIVNLSKPKWVFSIWTKLSRLSEVLIPIKW